MARAWHGCTSSAGGWSPSSVTPAWLARAGGPRQPSSSDWPFRPRMQPACCQRSRPGVVSTADLANSGPSPSLASTYAWGYATTRPSQLGGTVAVQSINSWLELWPGRSRPTRPHGTVSSSTARNLQTTLSGDLANRWNLFDATQGAAAMTPRYEVRPIGYVDSPLVDPKTAPRQGAEGALTHGWCSTPTWRKPPATSPSAPRSSC